VSVLQSWEERPRDEGNLFNPAFFGLLIERAANGHRERSGEGLPWPLIYLILPAVLHKETREDLPASVSTSMAAWTQSHPLLVGALPERARAMQPLVRQGLLFGMRHRLVRRDADLLCSGQVRLAKKDERREPTDDFRSCATKAAFFGRWVAASGMPATIFALWGVRP
jgi:hypothetical protein